MNAPRVDLFSAVHKGLRFSMYETGSLLERTNFRDEGERARAVTAVATSLAFFDEHLLHEDTHVGPRLKELAPALAKSLAGQHRSHEDMSASMKKLLADLGPGDSLTHLELGQRLAAQFNALIAEQSDHMNREETEANTVFWTHCDDGELVGIRGAIQGSIPPERFAQWLHIMLPNMNHQELVGMLGGMKTHAPPQVFASVSGLAKSLLGERWPAIEATL